MVAEKVLQFQGKNVNLEGLSQQIVHYLQSDGYKTQTTTASLGIVIQAQKAGIMRDIITADRAFTIMITGQPNDFAVHIGIGKWIQNIAVAAAEALLLFVLFLEMDVPEILWTHHDGERASLGYASWSRAAVKLVAAWFLDFLGRVKLVEEGIVQCAVGHLQERREVYGQVTAHLFHNVARDNRTDGVRETPPDTASDTHRGSPLLAFDQAHHV